MNMIITTEENCTIGKTPSGRPHHCSFRRKAGEINIDFTGRVLMKMGNNDEYIETTVEEMEALIAQHKKNSKR